MATHRMLPPGNGNNPTCVANGRIYTAALGSYVDAANQSDAFVLEANGWIRSAKGSSGTTAQRPTTIEGGLLLNTSAKGYQYLDTTLGYIIEWDGATWRNPASGASI